MIYATLAQMERDWGADFLGDLLPADVDYADAYDVALSKASAEIDIHLSARYALPLPAAPAGLVTPCVNMAVYHVAIRHTALTTTIEDRYKQAVELLERIADGKAGLGAEEPRVSSEPEASAGGAYFTANGRLFSRGSLP